MSTHEEFEVGHELDRALRAAVTGVAQLMERYARRRQDASREGAAQVREDWLAQRDAARRQYLPWTTQARLDKLDASAASQKWAAAAAWSGMDPTARAAEQQMAEWIVEKHGAHPSVFLRDQGHARAGDRAGQAPAVGSSLLGDQVDVASTAPDTAVKLLSMNEAHGLATTHAPWWYEIPEEIQPLEVDRAPVTAAEEAFHGDWQYFSEAGVLPERSQFEQWARHVERSEEFAPEKWTTTAGNVDEEARDTALAAVWAEGHQTRADGELVDHEAAMHAADMGDLGAYLGDIDEVVPDHSWHAYLTPSRFDAAPPEDLARAWRDASAAALGGDVGAQRSAERLATMMRERRGLNPDGLLIGALSEQSAVNAEARRDAEDKLRQHAEAAGNTHAAQVVVPSPSPAAGAGVSRQRVIELNDMAAEFYASNLRPGTAGHRYFTERLGAEFESGPWALGATKPGWQTLSLNLRERGASDEEMVAAGLAEPGRFGVRDVFRDRAMMGIRDHETGELVGFVGRDLSGDARAPKVRNTAETPAFRKGDHVFGLYEAGPDVHLVTVEGPFDALATSLAAEHQAAGVSTMGTAMTETQAAAIAARSGGRVWTGYDNDGAGRTATEAAFFKLGSKGVDVRQVDVPGSDPAEAWKERPAFLRQTLADLPMARTAAETVVDLYLADPEKSRERVERLTGGPVRSFDDLMDRVGAYVPDPIARDLLALRAGELDQARHATTAAEGEEAAVRGEHEDLVAQADGARPSDEQRAGQLEAAASDVDDELHTVEGATDDAAAREALAYDRRQEAQGVTDQAAVARDGSSHGFSQSTADQVATAPVRRGAAAKVQRNGPGTAQGRTLRR